jgi:hypothetical protein
MPKDNNNFPANCQACGSEHPETELKLIRLSGFEQTIAVCECCLSKTAEDSFKDAARLLDEIVQIAGTSSGNPERRLRAIKALIGE